MLAFCMNTIICIKGTTSLNGGNRVGDGGGVCTFQTVAHTHIPRWANHLTIILSQPH